jgi:hypothetical protein
MDAKVIQYNTGETEEIDSAQNDKTFNRLRDLQFLIKKESALKELCKKIFNI